MGSSLLEGMVESPVSVTKGIYDSLRPNLRDNLTYEQREFVDSLDRFEAPYLEKKLLSEGKFKSSEEYQRAFTEFKKYAALGRFTDLKPLGMASQQVDEVWHQFILFTREYAQFCDAVLGEFLHHSPHTSKTPNSRRREGTRNFAEVYQGIFGDIPDIWSVSSSGPECSADLCGTDSCSGCGNQCAKCD